MRSTLVRAHMWRHIAHRERRRTWSNDELLAKPIASAPPMPKRTAGANSAAVPPRSCLDPQPTMTAMRAMLSPGWREKTLCGPVTRLSEAKKIIYPVLS